MQPLHVIAVGKLGQSGMSGICGEYLERLGAFCRPSMVELPECRLPREPSAAQVAQVLAKEAEMIRQKIPPRTFTVALCIEGEGMSSHKLAGVLENAAQHYPSAAFLIGSSYGLDSTLKKEAKLRLSMSPMTFPHQLARIMLLEQLYRAASIQNGGKYHK